MSEIETARLRLRPFADGDLDRLAGLHGDADVMALMRGGARDRDQAMAELAGYCESWRDHGFGMWALFAKPDGGFVGECGLRMRGDGLGIGLRFVIASPWWGRGLADEAVNAVLRYAFDVAGIERVVAVSRAVNAPSRRVMERAGMVFEDALRKETGGRCALRPHARWVAQAGGAASAHSTIDLSTLPSASSKA